jgi:Na+/H+-dicarboxylate symporter
MRVRLQLHWQIILALVLAVLAGAVTGTDAGFLGIRYYAVYDFLGTLFLNALKMIIVPLVISSIITGVAGIGDGAGLGRLGLRTLLYYASTSLIAILVGLFLVNLIAPGIVDGEPARSIIPLDDRELADVQAKVEGRGAEDLVQVFLRMIPTNVVAAAADGQMLGLIFFSLLFGFYLMRIADAEVRQVQNRFWQGLFEVMMRMTELVMRFAPLGVFALVAKVVARTGWAAFEPLMVFFVTVLLALAVHFFVVMPLILRLVAGVHPWRHYRAMAPALLTVFSTASSSATLPVTMECVEKNAGVSNRVSSFVLPLGATVNMDGTALYECVAAMFIAQAFGIELTFAQQFMVVLIALLTSIGVAGIPAASLVAISIILTAVGLPAEAIGLILAVDRILDMLRSSVNVFSDSCGAVVIARLEGERHILEGGQTGTAGSEGQARRG